MKRPDHFENEMFIEDLLALEAAQAPQPRRSLPVNPVEMPSMAPASLPAPQQLPQSQMSPPPMTEEEILAKARADRDKMQQYAMMLRGFQNVIGSATGAKTDMGVADSIAANADIGIRDLIADSAEKRAKAQDQRLLAGERRADSAESRAVAGEAREAQKAPLQIQGMQQSLDKGSLDIEDQKKKKDATSPESVLAQDSYLQAFPNANAEMVRKSSAEEIYRVFKPAQEMVKAKLDSLAQQNAERRMNQADRRLDQQDTKEGRLSKQFGYRKMAKFEDDASKAVSALRQTDTWKAAEKALAEVPTIKNLVNDAIKNGGQSLAMLGPRIAKGIAGEVGVLTEQDVTRYVQNPALVPGMMDTLAKMKSGKLTEASGENILRLLDIMEKESNAKIAAATAREAKLFAKRQGIPIEDAMYFIDESYDNASRVGEKTDEYEIKETGKLPESNVSTVLMKSPDGQTARVKADQVEKYKAKGAIIVQE